MFKNRLFLAAGEDINSEHNRWSRLNMLMCMVSAQLEKRTVKRQYQLMHHTAARRHKLKEYLTRELWKINMDVLVEV